LSGLIELEAQAHEALAELVVARIAGHDRREQLERAGEITEHVLAQRAEPPLHLDAARPAHLTQLVAQHLDGALGLARLLVGVGERCGRSQPELAMLEQLLRQLARVRMRWIQEQKPFDVAERALRVLEHAEADVHRLLAPEQRLLRRGRRLFAQRVFEQIDHVLVTPARQQPLHHGFARRAVRRIQLQDALPDLDREIGGALVALHELGAATQQRYFAFGIRGARAGVEIVLSQTRRRGLIGEQLFEQRERFTVAGNG
jgi:hypothetical protein